MSTTLRRDHQLRRLSRFLGMLLRHRPSRFPLKLDDQGFAALSDVMRILHALPNFRWATRADVDAVVDASGRKRFEVVQDGSGSRIRALYGHTALRPTYAPIEPPDVLYYGVDASELEAIRRDGIYPRRRQYIHLTPELSSACQLALREASEPVVLRIDAANAHREGVLFYCAVDGVYLVAHLPPRYLDDT